MLKNARFRLFMHYTVKLNCLGNMAGLVSQIPPKGERGDPSVFCFTWLFKIGNPFSSLNVF